MTRNFRQLLLLSSIAMATALHGWGSSDYVSIPLQTTPAFSSASSFPLNADQAWFVKPSLLVWRPYQDDIDPGSTILLSSLSPMEEKIKIQNVDFEWATGIRLTIGRYLPHHEQWDITLASTYFYSEAEKEIKGKGVSDLSSLSLPNAKFINEGWNPTLLGPGIKTDLSWRVNYYTWDLAIGRLFLLTPKIVIHPFLCLRSMLIYEKYSNKNHSFSLDPTGAFFTPRTSRFRLRDSVWGIGPRIGSDFSFYFGHRWSFMGSLSGSVVMGRYNLKERIDGFILGSTPSTGPSTKLDIRDADTNMHANLEGNIGLGWEKWVRNHTVRIAPSFLFEVSQWFLINNWVATSLPSTTGNPDWGMLSSRRMGDLGFLGFNVNLQIDF
jgi:hypothetical protein